MSNEKRKLLVFIDNTNHNGHEVDFRFAIKRALNNIPYWVFEDLPKKPENMLSAVTSGILFSHAILIDDTHRTHNRSSDLLIKRGICYALKKQCTSISIKNNSSKVKTDVQKSLFEGDIEFDYYLDLAAEFKTRVPDKLENSDPVYKNKPNKLPVHSFIALGIDRWKNCDLYEVVTSFSSGTGWTPRIVTDIGFLSTQERLANAISQRSFCLFCLDGDYNEQTYLGIGLAIGMGRPFLILKHKNTTIPASLSGYHGIIEYESYTQLREKLNNYACGFLSDNIFEWEGANYNDLLSQLEKRIAKLTPALLNEYEEALLTVSSIVGGITAKPFALLGEIYREKNHKISPDNVELLKAAKDYYEKALKIQNGYQLYQNAVSAIDKHIQLIELITEKKYRSIPVLINLIGGELKDDHYLQVKEYLLGIVNKLVEEKDFLHAISLLAAMQVHDTSKDIQILVQKILNLAPLEVIKALQTSQEYVAELENEKILSVLQIKEKNTQIEENVKELVYSKNQLITMKESLELIQAERDQLTSKLTDISSQLGMTHKKVDKLETEIQSAKALGGRGVIVDFGHGWAIYETFESTPYVVRNGDILPAYKGLVLHNGDIIVDENGHQLEEYLPSGSIVIKPKDDYYQDVNDYLNRNSS